MRKAGVLLSVTSLPSPYGIGCFSKEAYEFIDFLKSAGQSYWQVLPLGPTGFGDSPYQSFSTFAGNPYLIDLDSLVGEGVLSKCECDAVDLGQDRSRVDYKKQYDNRFKLLRSAFENSNLERDFEFKKFKGDNKFWLNGYAEFMARKTANGGAEWKAWNNDNQPPEREVQFWEYLQYKFYSQWYRLKEYANRNGISIIGDIPIYVAYDSADVWKSPELFCLNENLDPIDVAGCPPDGFSQTGQLWGNPLYDWEKHKKDGYSWWIKRLEHCFNIYDAVRIDHFRGFAEYYAIPYGSETAQNGKWVKGPGADMFKEAEKVLGKRKIIAEDLGYITDSVRDMLSQCGFMGMKVFEFAFDERDGNDSSMYLPHNYPENCAAYTATHDNEPVTSWFSDITEYERTLVRQYLCDKYTPDSEIALPIISRVMQSDAGIVIIPLQDYLKKGTQARMNVPSTIGTNWTWRILPEEISQNLCDTILALTKPYGR